MLRLTASDGTLSASDTMTVIVNETNDPVTVSFQDGVLGYNGTRDTKLNTNSKNTNYGSATSIDLDGSPDVADLFYLGPQPDPRRQRSRIGHAPIQCHEHRQPGLRALRDAACLG